MESADEEGLRLRKQALSLRPIQTKTTCTISTIISYNKDGDEDGDDDDDDDEQAEPVSPAGLFFNEPNFNVHIVAIIGSNSKVDPDFAKQNLSSTLLRHPRFSSLLAAEEKDGGKKMKWVRTKVDLDKHVIVGEINNELLGGPGDKVVEDYIYNLTKTRSKPLWDLHILNVKTSNAESVLILRVHHSLGDGISLMSLLFACTRQINNPQAFPPRKPTLTTTLQVF